MYLNDSIQKTLRELGKISEKEVVKKEEKAKKTEDDTKTSSKKSA